MPALVGWLDEVAAIVTAADWNQLRQRDEPARVVGVEVAENKVIDPRQPSLSDGRCDPFCVALAA